MPRRRTRKKKHTRSRTATRNVTRRRVCLQRHREVGRKIQRGSAYRRRPVQGDVLGQDVPSPAPAPAVLAPAVLASPVSTQVSETEPWRRWRGELQQCEEQLQRQITLNSELQEEIQRLQESQSAAPCITGEYGVVDMSILSLQGLAKFGLLTGDGRTTQWIRCKGVAPGKPGRSAGISGDTLSGLYPFHAFYLSERDKLEMDVINGQSLAAAALFKQNQEKLRIPNPGASRPAVNYTGIYRDLTQEGGTGCYVSSRTPGELLLGLSETRRDESWVASYGANYPRQYTYISPGISLDDLHTYIAPKVSRGSYLPELVAVDIQVPCTREEALAQIPGDVCTKCGQGLKIPPQIGMSYHQERIELADDHGITIPPWPHGRPGGGHVGKPAARQTNWNKHIYGILFPKKPGEPSGGSFISQDKEAQITAYTPCSAHQFQANLAHDRYFKWVRLSL